MALSKLPRERALQRRRNKNRTADYFLEDTEDGWDLFDAQNTKVGTFDTEALAIAAGRKHLKGILAKETRNPQRPRRLVLPFSVTPGQKKKLERWIDRNFGA